MLMSKTIILNQSKDPTRTLALRNRASTAVNGRFKKIATAIRKAVVTENVLGGSVVEEGVEVNQVKKRKYTYEYVPLEDTEFTAFLEALILKELDLRDIGEYDKYWLNTYIGSGYEAGVKSSRSKLEKQATTIAGAVGVGDLPFDSPLLNPAHVERAALIYTRTFNKMKSIALDADPPGNPSVINQLREVLTEGITNGNGPEVVARAMVKRVNVGRSRARLIARTEIVNAHQTASLQEIRNVQESFGSIEVKALWEATLDGRERPEHHEWNGQVFTVEEAESRKGEPNCRCSISPWIPDFDEE